MATCGQFKNCLGQDKKKIQRRGGWKRTESVFDDFAKDGVNINGNGEHWGREVGHGRGRFEIHGRCDAVLFQSDGGDVHDHTLKHVVQVMHGLQNMCTP